MPYLVRLGHASNGLDIHQRLALPRCLIEQVTTILPRLPKVAVANLAKVIEPDVPRVPPDLR